MRRSPAIRLSLALMAAAALAVATYAGARAGRVSAEARLIGSYTWAPPVQPEKPWFGGFSGIVVDGYGYFTFFWVAAALGVPAIVLTLYLMRTISERPAVDVNDPATIT